MSTAESEDDIATARRERSGRKERGKARTARERKPAATQEGDAAVGEDVTRGRGGRRGASAWTPRKRSASRVVAVRAGGGGADRRRGVK